MFRFGLVYGVKWHFQQYFIYIVVISFIGEGNRSTWRKPQEKKGDLVIFLCMSVNLTVISIFLFETTEHF
jgi:hypothetical protein